MKKWTIAVDFDGVLHQYTSKWTTATDIRDPPMPGAFEWLREMTQHFKVVIFSARLTPHGNTEAAWLDAKNAELAMTLWFRENGLELDVLQELTFWMDPGKPTALIYIDDRGYRFEGTFPTRNQIHTCRPWKVTDG